MTAASRCRSTGRRWPWPWGRATWAALVEFRSGSSRRWPMPHLPVLLSANAPSSDETQRRVLTTVDCIHAIAGALGDAHRARHDEAGAGHHEGHAGSRAVGVTPARRQRSRAEDGDLAPPEGHRLRSTRTSSRSRVGEPPKQSPSRSGHSSMPHRHRSRPAALGPAAVADVRPATPTRANAYQGYLSRSPATTARRGHSHVEVGHRCPGSTGHDDTPRTTAGAAAATHAAPRNHRPSPPRPDAGRQSPSGSLTTLGR